MVKGKLYLIPSTLGGENLDLIITPFVKSIINSINYYIVEKEKHSRRYLRQLEIQTKIDDLELFPLNKHSEAKEINQYLAPCEDGFDMGLISEAGCPGVADPGAEIVALAHRKNIQVIPLTGPSSILLALMGSGFNGQNFEFYGYIPREQNDRIKILKEFENKAGKKSVTQIFMDTPYRNNHVLEDLLKNLRPDTELCIAVDLTQESEFIKTKKISDWRTDKINLNKRPCMFLIGKSVRR